MKFFRARLVRLGPFVGVAVWHGAPLVDGEELDRSHRWQVVVGAETTARAVLMQGDGGVPIEVDGITLRSVEPISSARHRYMTDHPKASPREAVDFATIRPPF